MRTKDLEIFEPFPLSFIVKDFEENLPSLQLEWHWKILEFQSIMEFNKKSWFHCQIWDIFVNNLKQDTTSTLHNLDEDFFIEIKPFIHIKLNLRRDKQHKIDFELISPLDNENYKIVKEKFLNFDTFW